MRRRGSLCWAFFALVAACGPAWVPGGPGIPGGPVPPSRGRASGLSAMATIGPAGGTLALVASDGGSLTMTVPAGALGAAVNFTIDEIATDPLVLIGAIGRGYRLGPVGAPLVLPVTLAFAPPPPMAPTGLTAAVQAAVGYWFRVYSVTRNATTVSVVTVSLGDWSLVTVATQRDLSGTFTLASTEALPFNASGTVTLQYLGEDSSFAAYLPQGTITLAAPVAKGTASCSPSVSTLELPASIAEIRKSPPAQFRWGINGHWDLACTDASAAFVSTNFDSLGITNIGCSRGYSGAFTISSALVQGTYLIDCGAGGSVSATWSLTHP